MADKDRVLYPLCIHDRPNITSDGRLVMRPIGFSRVPETAKIGRKHLVLISKCHHHMTPTIRRLGPAVQHHHHRAIVASVAYVMVQTVCSYRLTRNHQCIPCLNVAGANATSGTHHRKIGNPGQYIGDID